MLELALKEPELSPRKLAVSFVDQQQYFVSEASVYLLLKAHDLITSPAFILMKAADSFTHPTTAPDQLWQTDFTYLRVIGWGWFYLSTVLDDFSRYILAWKLCTTTTATDVSDTLAMALRRSGLERVRVRYLGSAAAEGKVNERRGFEADRRRDLLRGFRSRGKAAPRARHDYRRSGEPDADQAGAQHIGRDY